MFIKLKLKYLFFITLFMAVCNFIIIYAQVPLTIEFTVIDNENHSYLSGATIKIDKVGENTRTLKTNINGYIKFEALPPFKLTISYIGYETFSEKITHSNYKNFFQEQNKQIVLVRTDIFFNEIVTTGQFAPNTSQKSVFPVKVINREQIEVQAAPNLRDLLNNELNMQITQDGILGSQLTINGISGQNVKIMLDGVPVIGRLDGNIDLSQINLNNAERIEIIKGPMSAIYGTDALGGVINIITRKGSDENLKASVNSYYESVDIYNFDASLNYAVGKHSTSFSGGRYFFGGYSPVDTTRSKQWKPKIQYFGDLNYSYFINSGHLLRYAGKYYYDYILNRGNLRSPRFENAFDDTYETYRYSNSLFYNGNVAKDKYVEAIISYSNYERQKHTFLNDLVNLKKQKTNNPDDHNKDIFNSVLLRATYSNDNALSTLSYQTGFDINLDKAKGNRIDGGSKIVNDYAWFLSFQYSPLLNFTLQPSLRLIHNTQYDAPIVPSLNLKYNINDKLTARGSYARGFRAPAIRELYFLFVDVNHNIAGSEDLIAETSHSFNFELNYHINNESYILQIEPSLFYNDIQNLITLAESNPSEQLYNYINIGNYKTVGGSLMVNYYRSNIAAKFGYTHLGTYNQYSGDYNLRKFNFNSSVSANILYDFKNINTKLALTYKYTGERPGFTINNQNNIAEYKIDGYHLLDATISKEMFDSFLQLSIGVKNIFDVNNINISEPISSGSHSSGSTSSSVAWGRTFFTSLKINI